MRSGRKAKRNAVVITVSREYGSGALAIAHRVVDTLGYLLVDTQLPVVVAAQFGTTADDVEAIENSGPEIGERFLTVLQAATPEISAPGLDDAELTVPNVRRAIEDEIRRYAAAGNCLIYGRAAGHVIDGPQALRVFLHAPRPWRIARLCDVFGIDRRTAVRELERVDAARDAYVRERYRAVVGDARSFDLALDVTRYGVEGSAELIVDAVRRADER